MGSLFNFTTLFIIGAAAFLAAAEEVTHFVQPLKNITAAKGSNLEFSCSVFHLETARVIWFHKTSKRSTEAILAVNGLKITKNPRISFSLVPRSGDVMESILYLFNVQPEDGGIYICGVNTEPMIFQEGTLEVTQSKVRDLPELSPVSPSPKAETPPTTSPPANGTPSQIFCFDVQKIWTDTKREAEILAKNIWEKVSSWF